MAVTPDLAWLCDHDVPRATHGTVRARAVVVVTGLGLNLGSLVGLGMGLGRGLLLLIYVVSAFVSGIVLVRDERRDEIDPVLGAAMAGVRVRLQPATASIVGSAPGRVSRMACRVAAWSVRMLPAPDRERYCEELTAELYDLRGLSRCAQLRYAVRLLVRAVCLRRVLRPIRSAVAGAWERDG